MEGKEYMVIGFNPDHTIAGVRPTDSTNPSTLRKYHREMMKLHPGMVETLIVQTKRINNFQCKHKVESLHTFVTIQCGLPIWTAAHGYYCMRRD